MVEISGPLGDDVKLIMEHLKENIEYGKRVVTAAHNFELKLEGFDTLLAHAAMYLDDNDLVGFIMLLCEDVISLRDKIKSFEKEELHIAMKEEVAMSKPTWTVKHKKQISKEEKQELAVDKQIIETIKTSFSDMKDHMIKVNHLFSIDIQKGSLKLAELQEKHKELEYISQELFSFINSYEQIFERFLLS